MLDMPHDALPEPPDGLPLVLAPVLHRPLQQLPQEARFQDEAVQHQRGGFARVMRMQDLRDHLELVLGGCRGVGASQGEGELGEEGSGREPVVLLL